MSDPQFFTSLRDLSESVREFIWLHPGLTFTPDDAVGRHFAWTAFEGDKPVRTWAITPDYVTNNLPDRLRHIVKTPLGRSRVFDLVVDSGVNSWEQVLAGLGAIINEPSFGSSWTNLREMFVDMRKFAQTNFMHTFINADQSTVGAGSTIGFSAFLADSSDEQHHTWSISLRHVKESIDRGDIPRKFFECFKAAAGRKVLLEFIIGRPLEPLPPV